MAQGGGFVAPLTLPRSLWRSAFWSGTELRSLRARSGRSSRFGQERPSPHAPEFELQCRLRNPFRGRVRIPLSSKPSSSNGGACPDRQRGDFFAFPPPTPPPEPASRPESPDLVNPERSPTPPPAWDAVSEDEDGSAGWDLLSLARVDNVTLSNAEDVLDIQRWTSDSWIRAIITIPNSRVLRAVSLPVAAVTCVNLGLVFIDKFVKPMPTLSATPHFMLSTALGMLLVLRTDVAYENFSSARKCWGKIISEIRDFSRVCLNVVSRSDDPEAPFVVGNMLLYLYAYTIALKNHLRRNRKLDELRGLLPAEDIQRIEESRHMSMYCCKRLSLLIGECEKLHVSHWRLQKLDDIVAKLVEAIGENERIVKTPTPLSYRRHTSRFVVLWMLTLPFVIVHEYGWFSPLVSFAIAYSLLGIDAIGDEIEEPFGLDENDLPLDQLTERVIKADVLTALQEVVSMAGDFTPTGQLRSNFRQ